MYWLPQDPPKQNCSLFEGKSVDKNHGFTQIDQIAKQKKSTKFDLTDHQKVESCGWSNLATFSLPSFWRIFDST